MEFLRKLFSITSFLFITFFLVGCETDGILEDLDHGPTENTFCPLNRLPNGLCPSKQKANVSAVSFTNSDGSFGLGSDIYLKITFNEEVEVTGSPKVELETGVTDRFAFYNSGSGTKDLIFKYTSQLGDINSDLDYKATSSLSLSGGKINNLYGNASILTLPAVGTLAANHAINVETSSAVVTGVSFSTSDNSYGAGSDIDITVTFNKNVDVTGSPQIELETGTTDRFASYQSGTGTSSLVFRYQVQAGDTNSDLDYKATNSLDLNGGTIKDIATNDAILTLPAVGTLATAHAVNIDTTGPTISGVSFASSNASYGVGTTVDLTVTFNEVVSVNTTGGTPQIELETGATDHFAIYQTAAASSSITFRYTVQAGNVNSDLDYKATTSLSLNSGTIKDAAGNNATLTLPSVGTLAAAHAINVETTAPTVTGVAFSSSDGNYAAASNIDMTVTFSEVVNVVTTGGTPRVELETGTTDRFANYLTGTGTNTLTFRYTVQSGDVNIDLDYKATNSLTLNGGTIKDNASNNATLTLPAVGTLATAHDIGAGVTTWIWDFSSSGDYTYPSNYVEVSGGKASLKTVDTTFSGTDFNSGTHVGTYYDSILDTLKLRQNLDVDHSASWTPQYSSLVGYWKLDGPIGSISNGGGVSATIGINGVVAGSNGQYINSLNNQGFYSSGTTEIQIGDGTQYDYPVSDFTVSYWVLFPEGADNPYWTIGKGNAYNGTTTCGNNPGGPGTGGWGVAHWTTSNPVLPGLFLSDGVECYTVYGGASIARGVWGHIVIRVNRSTNVASIFVNGIKSTTSIASLGSITHTTSGNRFFSIGRGAGSKMQNTTIDDVAIWDVALTDSEISTIYNKQIDVYSVSLSPSWTPKWNNIVGYWKMDGNWQDSSGNGNHGIRSGTGDSSPEFSSDAIVGTQSGSFDGSDDLVTVADSSEIDFDNVRSMTIAFWIYVSDLSSDQAILEKRIVGDDGWWGVFTKPSGNVCFDIASASLGWNPCTVDIPISENQWYHIAYTRDLTGNIFSAYRNGKLVTTASDPKIFADSSSSASLRIGGRVFNDKELNGKLDELSIWGVVLDPNEIKAIYNRQKQKYAGHYESPVINLGASGNWDNLKPKTTLPFYKELTTTSESSSDYSVLSGDLSNGLVGYWTWNEATGGTASGGADFEDKSGNGAHGNEIGGVSFGEKGILSNAVKLDGTDDYIDIGPSNNLIVGDSSFSFSVWFKTSELYSNGDNYGGRFITLQRSAGSSKVAIGINGDNTSNVMLCGVGCSTKVMNSSVTVNDSKWHHVVGMYNAATNEGSLFFDGGNKVTGNLGTLDNSSVNIATIGAGPGSGQFFNGKLDEILIYDRLLTDVEVNQLYRRGANRIKYQIKSCIDASCNCKSYSVSPAGSSMDCDGDGTPNSTDYDDVHKADWIGKNGAGDTFSELQNCVSIDGSGNCNGDVNDTPADFLFSDFPAAAQPANNQYFQYRVLMEAEENTACTSGATCMPELESVEIGPTGRYYGGSPEVTPASSSVTYNDINKIVFANTGSCTVKYQLSKDGSTYKYWNGSAWATASGLAQANDSSTISSNIGTFTSQVGTGILYWKAFLSSDTSQSCDLDTISVTVPD